MSDIAAASPQRSVRQALAELQLKTRLLEEERDYYASLHAASTKAFADHRSELQLLLAKEREFAAFQEAQQQRQLEALLRENEGLHAQSVDARSQNSARLSGAVDQLAHENATRERRLRGEVDACHRELVSERQAAQDAQREAQAVGAEVAALREQQAALQARLRQESERNQALLLARREAPLPASAFQELPPAPSSNGPRNARRRALAAPPPFIPAGNVRMVEHNVNAIVETIARCNYRSPTRRGRAPGAASGGGGAGGWGSVVGADSELGHVCRSLLSELLELRAEYEAIVRHLGDRVVAADVDANARATSRLREVFAAIDKKTNQLRQLRQSQSRLDDHRRLQTILRDVLEENSDCVNKHAYLMSLIRGD